MKDFKKILEASNSSYKFFIKYGGKRSEEVIREFHDKNFKARE